VAQRTRFDEKRFRDATREQSSLLAPIEKLLLRWFATRMPAWINSDHLTLLGFAAMLAAGVFYAAARWNRYCLLAVIVCLALNWFGDSLDGTLARVRNQQRPRYGFYVDHVVDAIGIFFLIGGLALSGYMSPFVAAGLLVAYFMLCLEVYLATYSLGTFKMSYFKIGPTELRIILALGNLKLLLAPTVTLFGYTFLLFDVGGVVAAAALAVTFLVAAASNTRALYLAEPIRASTFELRTQKFELGPRAEV
jgi:phosphatidylglycerophosphate synthase